MVDVKTCLDNAQEKMDMAIMYLEEALAHIRAGKASARLLDGIRVDSYGSMVPISNVAAITTPGSKLPSAEKFESWIFDELVPETLKNGGYLLKKNGETDNELLARAILLAQNRIKERDSRISALEKENNYAILKLKLQAPKVQYYDKVLQSQSTYTTTQIAKELGMTAAEDVKKVIVKLYKKDKLEGVVFVGDIPIPMLRKAQHMTSAFKMDEKNNDWRDSSVPSDRFYDDFDLQFDFLKQDSVENNFFYYNLAIKSPQQIRCDIYSARVKAVDNGEEPHAQISRYFKKVVAEHQINNKLDQFFSYTGDGSYSNSLTAWTPGNAQGIEYGGMPPVSSVGFDIKLTF